MSIDIRELDASPTLRNLSKEEKQAVVRLMELSIEETMKANNARIEKLESKLALCLVKLSELNHEGYSDTIAEDVFETWQEIRNKAGRS